MSEDEAAPKCVGSEWNVGAWAWTVEMEDQVVGVGG
jgi:hypothetical protein